MPARLLLLDREFDADAAIFEGSSGNPTVIEARVGQAVSERE
jgi:hypothetical protein